MLLYYEETCAAASVNVLWEFRKGGTGNQCSCASTRSTHHGDMILLTRSKAMLHAVSRRVAMVPEQKSEL